MPTGLGLKKKIFVFAFWKHFAEIFVFCETVHENVCKTGENARGGT
jgi:hypothetical protein